MRTIRREVVPGQVQLPQLAAVSRQRGSDEGRSAPADVVALQVQPLQTGGVVLPERGSDDEMISDDDMMLCRMRYCKIFYWSNITTENVCYLNQPDYIANSFVADVIILQGDRRHGSLCVIHQDGPNEL